MENSTIILAVIGAISGIVTIEIIRISANKKAAKRKAVEVKKEEFIESKDVIFRLLPTKGDEQFITFNFFENTPIEEQEYQMKSIYKDWLYEMNKGSFEIINNETKI